MQHIIVCNIVVVIGTYNYLASPAHMKTEGLMNWLRAFAGILVLWSSSATAATMTWSANTESDLAGYRIYQCNVQPCAPSSGNQSLLITLGKVTTFDIGITTSRHLIRAIASREAATF